MIFKRLARNITHALVVNMFTISLARIFNRMFREELREMWGRAVLATVKNKGRQCRLEGYCRILNPENLKIGDEVSIGYDCFLFCLGGVTIGEHTILSRQVTIYSAFHNYKSGGIPFGSSYIKKPVEIGPGVWIGMNVTILPGVKIGKGAIIGMNALVSKNVPDGAIVVGPSAKQIGSRDMESFYHDWNKGRFYEQK